MGIVRIKKAIFYLLVCLFACFCFSYAGHISISSSCTGKPISYENYLIIPEHSSLRVIDESFNTVKNITCSPIRYLKVNQNSVDIYSLHNDSRVELINLDNNLNENRTNFAVIPHIEVSKFTFFIDYNIIFNDFKVIRLNDSRIISLPFDKMRFINADDRFVYLVDVYDKLNVFNIEGQLVGKYNLGSSVSGIVMLDQDHFSIASIKGLYVISKGDFIVRRKHDFPKTPMGLYYYPPFVIIPTVEKLHIYNYSNDTFVSIPYSKITSDDIAYEYSYEVYWYNGKRIYLDPLDCYTYEYDPKLVYVDVSMYDEKIYAIVYRRREFGIRYYYYKEGTKKRDYIEKRVYLNVGEIIRVNTNGWSYSNTVIDSYRSRHDNIFFREPNFRPYIVKIGTKIYLVKTYRESISFEPF
ncbi:MAG: hypothetical protein ABDH21_06240 [bacterium]